MFESDTNVPLPSDNELVCRENALLKLFNKYSIDEGEDAELVDFDALAEENVKEGDDNRSGSSFSEASSIEGDSVNSSEMETMEKELQPLVQQRVEDWPKNGINLQLKRTDPSVTVDEWLNANQEFTTTTKKYKKIVVNEDRKTIITTTKQTKTTTKKSSFNSFAPRFLGVQETPAINHGEKDCVVDTGSASPTEPKSRKGAAKKQTKPKDQGKVSKNASEKAKATRSILVDLSVPNKRAEENVETFAKPTQPSNKKKSDQVHQKKAAKPPPDIGHYKTRLRSMSTTFSSKENIVEQVQNERSTITKQPRKVTKQSTNKRDNQMELPLTSVVPFDQDSETVHRSRSPLRERGVNIRALRNVRVNIENMQMPAATVAIRTSARMQQNALQGAPVGASNETNGRRVTDCDRVIDCYNYEASSVNQSRRPRVLMTSEQLQRQCLREIVIHSPSSETLLGTKIDDTTMLVTRLDYKKVIGVKYSRKPIVSRLDNSVVAINRRFVYQPPIIDTAGENTDLDSECEDDLVTSYTNAGHIVSYK